MPIDELRFGRRYLGPDAVWDQTPPRPASSGATVIGDRARLARDLTPLLD
jgi:hypothetical protein